MEENKISVSDYLNDMELLEIVYTPYETKVNIVDIILSQVINEKYIDSAQLNRIKTQIFIESITNIDMSIKSDNNLDGYDELCFNNNLDELIELIYDEYERFDNILELKLNDFDKYNNSTSATLLSLKKSFSDFIKRKINDVNELVSNMDTKELAEKLKAVISENLEKYKG